jgi:MoaA/NifB/PqqE/SkfB family radical SAM enzyme
VNKKEKEFIVSHFNGVIHTTFNPHGPGVVRMHLIPPDDHNKAPSIVIINGKDIIPINRSWAFILAEFINNLNVYEGKEVDDAALNDIVNKTVSAMKQLYPLIGRKRITSDLWTIVGTLSDIAYGKGVSGQIGYLNIGEYAPHMKAPHRMDLMVSAMTVNGKWHCNQKCLHCYAAGQMSSDEVELSTEDWKKIIDKCREAGISQLTFTGGEPTLRKDLSELIKHARWFITRLNTNGVLLTEEYCAQLKEAELDNVQITFYAADDAVHNELVGAQNFEKTVAGIKNAVHSGLSVSINTPLCTLNENYVETLIFLHELGITYVTCSSLIITGNAQKPQSKATQLSHDELLQILSEAVHYCKENQMEISFTSPGWLEEIELKAMGLDVPSCGACLSNMAITPGGKVVPCQSWLSDVALGDFLKDDWASVWNSNRCLAIRENSRKMQQACPLKDKGETTHE